MSDYLSKPLYALTIGEYLDLSRSLLSEQAQKLAQDLSQLKEESEQSDILFLDDVLKLTGYKKPTIYSKVSRFEIPVLSRNKPLTFSREAILEWMKAGKPHLIDWEEGDFRKSILG